MSRRKPVLTDDLIADAQLVRDMRGQDLQPFLLRLPADMKDLVAEAAPALLLDQATLMRVALLRLLRDLGYTYPPRR